MGISDHNPFRSAINRAQNHHINAAKTLNTRCTKGEITPQQRNNMKKVHVVAVKILNFLAKILFPSHIQANSQGRAIREGLTLYMVHSQETKGTFLDPRNCASKMDFKNFV